MLEGGVEVLVGEGNRDSYACVSKCEMVVEGWGLVVTDLVSKITKRVG